MKILRTLPPPSALILSSCCILLLFIGSGLVPAQASHLSAPIVGVWGDTHKSPHISDVTLVPSSTFKITINVTEVTELLSYDIALQYFSDVLTAQAATLLPVEGKQFRELIKVVDDGTGTVRMTAALSGDMVTVATSAELFSIDFAVDKTGSTSLTLLQAKLGVLVGGQPTVVDVTSTAVHGSFTNTGARLPVASFRFNWTDTFPDGVITQGETVTFDASGSYDPDAPVGAPNKGIVSYEWSFGDETATVVESDPLIDHVFQDRVGEPKSGEFTVVLTVLDDPSNPGSNSKQSQRLIVARSSILEIVIDIKPGSDPNSINVKSTGILPVAVLTTASFDATIVDPQTARFGRTGTEATLVRSAIEDVDKDHDLDLVMHFNIQDTQIMAGDTRATLTGRTLDGTEITGTDSIRAFFPGDANGDLIVNVLDLASVGRAFGLTRDSPNWNAYADFNEDGRVDVLDLAVAGAYFGQHA